MSNLARLHLHHAEPITRAHQNAAGWPVIHDISNLRLRLLTTRMAGLYYKRTDITGFWGHVARVLETPGVHAALEKGRAWKTNGLIDRWMAPPRSDVMGDLWDKLEDIAREVWYREKNPKLPPMRPNSWHPIDRLLADRLALKERE